MKHIFITFFVFLVSASSAFANADIQRAEQYLQSLDKLQASFTQTYIDELNNEQILTGTFYLNRPGRLRFEFNEIDDFIVADGFFVYFYDAEERQQSNAPIGQTLADFLLRDKIELRDDINVSNIRKSNGYTFMTFTQTDDPQAGSLEMMFSDIPFQLQKWRVTDAQGTSVDVSLKDIKTDVSFKGGLFTYRDPFAPIGRLNE
ncbi:MAG: outer membrane lipoprotein carrier protein LolA [Pseudomonadota bacterium]